MGLFNWETPQNGIDLTGNEVRQIEALEEKAFFRKKLTESEWAKLVELRAKHLLSIGEEPSEYHLNKRRLRQKSKV